MAVALSLERLEVRWRREAVDDDELFMIVLGSGRALGSVKVYGGVRYS